MFFFCEIFQWWAGIHGDRAAILSCVVSAIVSLLAWTKITGFLDSWVVRLNICKCVCVYICEWMCFCEFIVMWECAKWVWLLMSVWMWVMAFVINWTIGMGTSAEKIHYFLQIYITSRNTLKFTWLLIIHRWGICPVCVSH